MSLPQTTTTPDSTRRFRYEDLLAFSRLVLEQLDVPADDARQTAECLLLAELRGVDSHGLVRLPVADVDLGHFSKDDEQFRAALVGQDRGRQDGCKTSRGAV